MRGGFIVFALIVVAAGAAPLAAQSIDAAGRPVAEVRVTGLKLVDPQFILNQVRVEAGQPYDPDAVARDIQNITRLGRFASVRADVSQNADGSVALTYVIEEQPLLADVQVVGNKAMSDQELLGMVLLRPGDPRDDFLIQRGIDTIERDYRDAGYYLAHVEIDDKTLADSDILVFRVREGPRVKVRDVAFEGNARFTAGQLQSRIETEEHMIIFVKGELSEQKLDQDVARLREFYQDAGYLDVRVDRKFELSPDQKSAVVKFVIDEGRQYTVRHIDFIVEGKRVYAEQTLREAMTLKIGSVYSGKAQQQSTDNLYNLYGKLGHLPRNKGGTTVVSIQRAFDEDEPVVDLDVEITEGRAYRVGNVIVRGNQTTQDKVVRRQIRGMAPGRRYDGAGLDQTQQRVRATGLFREAKVTVLGEGDEDFRDALVEVKEQRTGSISFGAAISSDAGILGALDVNQRNFDITDTPESLSELIRGRAFSGAGQQFAVSLQPGDELQRYSVSWSDPFFLDSPYFVGVSAQYFTREREDFDEERLGGTFRVGKRFGDVWSAFASVRGERIGIEDVGPGAPVDVFDVQGDSDLLGISFNVSRSTVDSRVTPSRGSRLVLSVERTVGDFNFTKFAAEGNIFFTLHEDFFGRKNILSFRSELGYIFEEDEAPLFERFYAGGHSSFRGFEFRGVGPRGQVDPDGIRNSGDEFTGDDPVGGRFRFLLGTEYSFPIFDEFVRGVVFIDSGTVDEDLAIDKWRVSVGTGLRLALPVLGDAPFAFDLAFPLLKEDDDETRIFSFSVALPF